jgi:hypothetical protein
MTLSRPELLTAAMKRLGQIRVYVDRTPTAIEAALRATNA